MKKKGGREILDNSGNTEILSLADQFRDFFVSPIERAGYAPLKKDPYLIKFLLPYFKICYVI